MKRCSLALLTAAFAMPLPASAQTIEERARAAAEASREKTSDSEAIQENYLTPGLAGQAISTVDNSQTFNPNIACQKTATLLELIAQPASTGDIGTLRISRDKNLDGAVDQTLTLPVPVSGICANGVVSCQPGTWNLCKSFKWDVASGGDLKLTEVGLTDLAGCYCVNNSCGSNLVWGNMASVLKDLGGGVIGALTTADPRVGVAQAVIDGPAIRYTGAQSTACSTDPSLPQTAYRASPAAIQGDAASAAASNSVFQALKGSPAGMGKAEQVRSCTITREVSLNATKAEDVIAHVGGAYATYAPSPDRLTFQMGSPRDDSLRGGSCRIFEFQMRLRVDDPDRLLQFRLSQYFFDDWIQLRIDGELVLSNPANWTGSGLPPAKCERGRTWYAYPNLDLKPWLTEGEHVISMRVAVGGEGEAFAQFDALLDMSCNPTERIVDLCAGYAGDANCTLHDETVDGVEIFRNGVATGLTPLPQTRLFEGGACSLSLTRDWFGRQRRYRCMVDTGSMPEPDLSRGAYIIDHSTETMLADRVKTADGGHATSSRPFALPDRGSVPACEPVCKTRAPTRNTAAALDGVVGAKQNAPTGWDTFYHACKTGSAGGDICPAGPGEEIVSACGCLDDFPEAVVMMQTVRLGGADLVCTGEVR
ncbi:hypothetical protein KFK14_07400 [Sphingobium phenoxybenzoativorans]|uniref:Conjugal transfer protein TraN n=2 Tax=Sphingobium TaxID=165695 RepID=A0A975Q388_9SPHN|nr:MULTISPECIES: hypothetical protein [Sphingobium]MDX3911368.1 hypothetical protein [Sphingobium sp.]QUT07228.1 hypothetical protein KFK14_07400 [Sphingobium phenoxybenzoativorans]BAV63215.1 hypothetical protein SCLO_1001750 [Sphingobium cloacae]